MLADTPMLQAHLDVLQSFENIYIGMLIMGGFYGLTWCNLSCIPLVGPYIFGTQGGFQRGFDATMIFMLTRIVMYTVMGGLSGWFGGVVLEYVDSSWMIALSGSLVLLIGATIIYRPKKAACKGRDQAQVQPPTRHTRIHMITLGCSTSMVPCLPLSAVLFYAAATGSFATGCLLALMFGIGTSASPLYYIGGATGWLAKNIRAEIPRYSGMLRIVSGIILVIFGVQLLLMSGSGPS
jgi:thiol:disulfide interchange protein DsbD